MYIEVYTYNTINLNISYKNETKNLVGTDVEKKKGKKGREKNINNNNINNNSSSNN